MSLRWEKKNFAIKRTILLKTETKNSNEESHW